MPQQQDAQPSNREGRIQLALSAYNAHQFRSLRRAADAFNVPSATLTRRYRGIPFRLESPANSHKLTTTQEQTIVQYILDLDWRVANRVGAANLFWITQWVESFGGGLRYAIRPWRAKFFKKRISFKIFSTKINICGWCQWRELWRSHVATNVRKLSGCYELKDYISKENFRSGFTRHGLWSMRT